MTIETIGEKIRKARKAAGLSSEKLAEAVSLSQGAVTKIERNGLKFGPSPDLVVKIADALGDKTILTTYLENNPVFQSVIFSDLNRRDPATIFSRFAAEAEEAAEAARILADIFSNADPSRTPNFCEVLFANLEQVVDIQRCAEVLFLQLIVTGVIDEADRCEIHRRQQQKCVDHGHHKERAA